VVEAALKSGSLITARLAGDYGREVMAVPGSPLDPRSHGCNEMIREGAILVQRVEDIIELLSSFDGVPLSRFHEDGEDVFGIGAEGDWGLEEAHSLPQAAPLFRWPEEEAAAEPEGDLGDRLLDMLGITPVGLDDLVRLSHASAAQVQTALIELELSGQILRHAGGRVSRQV